MPNGPVDVAAGAPNTTSYTDNGDGTVTDTVTGLMWQKVVPTGTFAQPEAVAFCQTLNLAGHNDWRLPSRIELLSIVDYGRANPSIDATLFGTPQAVYWSSSPAADSPSDGWFVAFTDGSADRNLTTTPFNARCVR
jgi:hypothetical protein